MKLSALLLLGCIALSSSAQQVIRVDKKGAIKKIRDESGKWVKAVPIASDADAAVYMAKRDDGDPNTAIVLVNYGKYKATVYVAYHGSAACIAAHPEMDTATAASICSTTHYSQLLLSMSYMDRKAYLYTRADIADDGTIEPIVHPKGNFVSFETLPSALANAAGALQNMAVEMYPEVAMTPPVTTCSIMRVTRNIGGAVHAPRLLHQSEPDYSEEARRKKFSGQTLVRLIVDVDGRPKCLHVIQLLPYGLTQKAMEAVARYVFEPATMDGKPVPVELNVAVNFQIF